MEQAPPVPMGTTTAAVAPLPIQAAASSHEQPQPPVNTGPASPGIPLSSAPGPGSAAPAASASADSELVAVRKVVGRDSFKQALHEMTEERLREVQRQCELVHSQCEQLLKKAEVTHARNP